MKSEDVKALVNRLKGNVPNTIAGDNVGDVLLELLELIEDQLRTNEETEYDVEKQS